MGDDNILRWLVVYSQPLDTGAGENVLTRLVKVVEFLKTSHQPLTLLELERGIGIRLRQDLELERAIKINKRVLVDTNDQNEEVFSFKRTYNIHNAQSLLVHLRTYITGGATDVKLLREDWAQVDGAIERLEREGRIGVIRNKDGSPKVVFYDELGDMAARRAEEEGKEPSQGSENIDEKFLNLWNETKLPNETDLPKELLQAGLTTSSGLASDKVETVKVPIKKKKGAGHRKIKITNNHLPHIDLSKDFLPQQRT